MDQFRLDCFTQEKRKVEEGLLNDDDDIQHDYLFF